MMDIGDDVTMVCMKYTEASQIQTTQYIITHFNDSEITNNIILLKYIGYHVTGTNTIQCA